jgi:hypothetical protein
MTEARKIAAAAKSNPATIFSEQRRVEQPARQVDGADRIWRPQLLLGGVDDGNEQPIILTCAYCR